MTTLVVAPRSRPAQAASGRAPERPQGRSLGGYLLVPRPKDLPKAVVAPLAFALGVAAAGGVGAEQGVRALLVWLALELLVYQARYQWNDVRGFAADQAHPDAAGRGRLPGPVERARPHITASVAVIVLRLLLAAALALTVPAVAGTVLGMTVGVFGVAVVYERLRSSATGHTAQVPVPVRPVLGALWVAVGAGYAVRGLTGLALAVDLPGRPGLVLAAAVAMWALGVVFVTCRWALEAMSFGSVEQGRVVWSVRADQAREHTLGLVRWLPSRAPLGVTDLCAWPALLGRAPLLAPWALALVVAGAASAVAGHLLSGPARAALVPVVLAVGAGAAVGVAQLPRARLLVGAAGLLLLALLEQTAGSGRPVVAVLPLMVVLAAHRCFVRQCAYEVGRPLHRVLTLLRR